MRATRIGSIVPYSRIMISWRKPHLPRWPCWTCTVPHVNHSFSFVLPISTCKFISKYESCYPFSYFHRFLRVADVDWLQDHQHISKKPTKIRYSRKWLIYMQIILRFFYSEMDRRFDAILSAKEMTDSRFTFTCWSYDSCRHQHDVHHFHDRITFDYVANRNNFYVVQHCTTVAKYRCIIAIT